MRDHGKLSPQFWIGETGRKLRGDPSAQVVAVYLVSSPHATAIGLYYLPIHFIAHETGLTVAEVDRALIRLEADGFAVYSREAEHVWIPEMARHQIGELLRPRDKRSSWVRAAFDRVAGSPLAERFLARYGPAFGLAPEQQPDAMTPEAPSMPLPAHAEAPSMPLRRGMHDHRVGVGVGVGVFSLREREEPQPADAGLSLSSAKPPDPNPTAPSQASAPWLVERWEGELRAAGLPPLSQAERDAFEPRLAGVVAEEGAERAAVLVEAWFRFPDRHIRGRGYPWRLFLEPDQRRAALARAEGRIGRRRPAAPAEPDEPALPPDQAKARLAALRRRVTRA